ncbi:hypothetical protein [Alkalicoccus urumqiensis]|nr:hypothetical protein [Alkalicoccus urumqiensis]
MEKQTKGTWRPVLLTVLWTLNLAVKLLEVFVSEWEMKEKEATR